MIVAVDARALSPGRGIARYTRAMTEALAAAFPADEYRLVTSRVGRLVRGLTAGGGADVAWLPAPAPVRVGPGRYVLTIHDLSWEERPHDFTAYERAWHAAARVRRLARGAARVVVDSRTTQQSLVARWGIGATVVAPGVTRPAGAPAANRRGRYLLAVGALEPRKAPELLLGAYARARARGLRADLVFAGTGRRARALAGRPGVHLAGTVSDEELDTLYAHALA